MAPPPMQEALEGEVHVTHQGHARGLKGEEIQEMCISSKSRDISPNALLESSSSRESPCMVIPEAPWFDNNEVEAPLCCTKQTALARVQEGPPTAHPPTSLSTRQLAKARCMSPSEEPAFEAHVCRQSRARSLKSEEIHEMRVSNIRRDKSPNAWLESSSSSRSPRSVMPKAPRFVNTNEGSQIRCDEQTALARGQEGPPTAPPPPSFSTRQLAKARNASPSEEPAFETHVFRQSKARMLKSEEIHEMRVSSVRRDKSPNAWLESSFNRRSPRMVMSGAPRFNDAGLLSSNRCSEQTCPPCLLEDSPTFPPTSAHSMRKKPISNPSDAFACEAHLIRQSRARNLQSEEIDDMRVSSILGDKSPTAWLESRSNHKSPRIVMSNALQFDIVGSDLPHTSAGQRRSTSSKAPLSATFKWDWSRRCTEEPLRALTSAVRGAPIMYAQSVTHGPTEKQFMAVERFTDKGLEQKMEFVREFTSSRKISLTLYDVYIDSEDIIPCCDGTKPDYSP